MTPGRFEEIKARLRRLCDGSPGWSVRWACISEFIHWAPSDMADLCGELDRARVRIKDLEAELFEARKVERTALIKAVSTTAGMPSPTPRKIKSTTCERTPTPIEEVQSVLESMIQTIGKSDDWEEVSDWDDVSGTTQLAEGEVKLD